MHKEKKGLGKIQRRQSGPIDLGRNVAQGVKQRRSYRNALHLWDQKSVRPLKEGGKN